MRAPAVTCTGLRRSYGPVTALHGLDLDVEKGELLAVLGPSGCGKTTLLRLIAGFERPNAGVIDVGGVVVAGKGSFIPPERRHVGIVVQDHALFPHLTVEGNVGYGLSRRRVEAEDRRARVAEVLDLVGLSGLGGRYPAELSGGQQQRVAIARALAPRPGVILLDEPFANLDAALRFRIRAEVRDILQAAGATGLLVTHDQEEALSLADRVAVMEGGRVLQVGTPDELYRRPVHPFVARFVGGSGLVPGISDGHAVDTVAGRLPVADPPAPPGPCLAVVRPDAVELGVPAGGPSATVAAVAYLGHTQIVDVRLDDGTTVRSRMPADRTFCAGELVGVSVTSPVVVFPTPTCEGSSDVRR